jgi:uncharacterized protein (TIGR03435 family)
MHFPRIAIALALAVGLAQSQTFEVASVKASGPDSKWEAGGGPGSRDPGQFHVSRASLLDLIAMAYNVEDFQISSRIALDRNYFDLAARVPAGATRQEFSVMLQNLLAARFHLKLHKESREFAAYQMVVAKNGPKLKESNVDGKAEDNRQPPRSSDDAFPKLPPDSPALSIFFSPKDGYIVARISAQQTTMSDLARVLKSPGDPPIVDKTGLHGNYDFRLEYAKPAPASAGNDPGVPDLSAALQQQLGLQIIRKKLPFDALVIDSFDSTPVAN